MTMWLVRAGKSGEKEALALDQGMAVIGWQEVADLGECQDRESVLVHLQAAYPTERRKTLVSWQNQIWPIVAAMQVGDLVALPLKSRATIAFGVVSGPYAYRTDLPDGPHHTRPVRWTAQIPRSDFDSDMLFSFGAFMTVCRIVRNDAEQRIRIMLDGSTWPAAIEPASPPSRPTLPGRLGGRGAPAMTHPEMAAVATGQIRDRIAQRFKGHRMAELVAALLVAEGYQAKLSPPGIDGGVDILAGRGPLGMDPPRLVVQVKSQDSKLDVRVLRELSGVMGRFQADQGLLVGWGGFNQAVRAEALGDYYRLRLWGADDLLSLIETHYLQLPAEIRADLPLKQIWTLAIDGPAAMPAALPLTSATSAGDRSEPVPARLTAA